MPSQGVLHYLVACGLLPADHPIPLRVPTWCDPTTDGGVWHASSTCSAAGPVQATESGGSATFRRCTLTAAEILEATAPSAARALLCTCSRRHADVYVSDLQPGDHQALEWLIDSEPGTPGPRDEVGRLRLALAAPPAAIAAEQLTDAVADRLTTLRRVIAEATSGPRHLLWLTATLVDGYREAQRWHPLGAPTANKRDLMREHQELFTEIREDGDVRAAVQGWIAVPPSRAGTDAERQTARVHAALSQHRVWVRIPRLQGQVTLVGSAVDFDPADPRLLLVPLLTLPVAPDRYRALVADRGHSRATVRSAVALAGDQPHRIPDLIDGVAASHA